MRYTVQYFDRRYAAMGASTAWFAIPIHPHYTDKMDAKQRAAKYSRAGEVRVRVVDSDGEEQFFFNALGEECKV